jgi:hypothetical protein
MIKKIHARGICKGIITGATIIACDEIMTFIPKICKESAYTQFMCHVAGSSLGFMLGKEVSEYVLDAIEGAIDAYNAYGGNE